MAGNGITVGVHKGLNNIRLMGLTPARLYAIVANAKLLDGSVSPYTVPNTPGSVPSGLGSLNPDGSAAMDALVASFGVNKPDVPNALVLAGYDALKEFKTLNTPLWKVDHTASRISGNVVIQMFYPDYATAQYTRSADVIELAYDTPDNWFTYASQTPASAALPAIFIVKREEFLNRNVYVRMRIQETDGTWSRYSPVMLIHGLSEDTYTLVPPSILGLSATYLANSLTVASSLQVDPRASSLVVRVVDDVSGNVLALTTQELPDPVAAASVVLEGVTPAASGAYRVEVVTSNPSQTTSPVTSQFTSADVSRDLPSNFILSNIHVAASSTTVNGVLKGVLDVDVSAAVSPLAPQARVYYAPNPGGAAPSALSAYTQLGITSTEITSDALADGNYWVFASAIYADGSESPFRTDYVQGVYVSANVALPSAATSVGAASVADGTVKLTITAPTDVKRQGFLIKRYKKTATFTDAAVSDSMLDAQFTVPSDATGAVFSETGLDNAFYLWRVWALNGDGWKSLNYVASACVQTVDTTAPTACSLSAVTGGRSGSVQLVITTPAERSAKVELWKNEGVNTFDAASAKLVYSATTSASNSPVAETFYYDDLSLDPAAPGAAAFCARVVDRFGNVGAWSTAVSPAASALQVGRDNIKVGAIDATKISFGNQYSFTTKPAASGGTPCTVNTDGTLSRPSTNLNTVTAYVGDETHGYNYSSSPQRFSMKLTSPESGCGFYINLGSAFGTSGSAGLLIYVNSSNTAIYGVAGVVNPGTAIKSVATGASGVATLTVLYNNSVATGADVRLRVYLNGVQVLTATDNELGGYGGNRALTYYGGLWLGSVSQKVQDIQWGAYKTVIEDGVVDTQHVLADAIRAKHVKTGELTLSHLNFTPLVSADGTTGGIVASINASSEGLQISASKIRIGGTTIFESSLYDPSTKATPTDVSNSLTQAKTYADGVAKTASDAAAAAQQTANQAKAVVDDITSDDVLSAAEKQALKPTYDGWVAERDGIWNQATNYSITTERDQYDAALTTLKNYASTTGMWTSLTTSTSLGTGGGATFRGYVSDFLSKKQTCLNKIADRAKQIAIDAGNAAASQALSDSKTWVNNQGFTTATAALTAAQNWVNGQSFATQSSVTTQLGNYASLTYLGNQLANYVATNALATAGQTVINGGNITTGVIAANLVGAGVLKGQILESMDWQEPSSSNNYTAVGFRAAGSAGGWTTYDKGGHAQTVQAVFGNNVMIGGYLFGDWISVPLNAIDYPGVGTYTTTGRVFYKGNNIQSTRTAPLAPNIQCLNVQCTYLNTSLDEMIFQFALKPINGPTDNLDAMRWLKVEFWRSDTPSAVVPYMTHYFPITDRLYASATDSDPSNTTFVTYLYNSEINWAGYNNGGDPYFYFKCSLANAYGISDEAWYIPATALNTNFTNNGSTKPAALTGATGGSTGTGGTGGGGGSTGCLPAGSLFNVYRHGMGVVRIPIERVEVGDYAMGYDHKTLRPLVSRICKTYKYEDREIYEVRTVAGTLVCSHDHRLAHAGKDGVRYVPARDLKPGDFIYKKDRQTGVVFAVEVLESVNTGRKDTVYHVDMEEGHVYVGADFLAHNVKMLLSIN